MFSDPVAPQATTAAPAANPSLTVGTPDQNDVERRLKRLEDMMQMLLAQTQGQHRSDRQAMFGRTSGSLNAASAGGEAVTLSELKKQRIDLEDELENIQERMAKIDEQVAKLQSAHSNKAPVPSSQAR